VRALTNAQWGFESNCFVCEAANERGLRIEFLHDQEARRVVAEFCLDSAFSGAPSYVHGGIVLAILDEAMAWATIAIAGRFAVTTTTTARFDHPVRVDRAYRVEARVTEVNVDVIEATAAVSDSKNRKCATASASFAPLGPAQARSAIGTELRGEDAGYLRPS